MYEAVNSVDPDKPYNGETYTRPGQILSCSREPIFYTS